MSPVRRKALKKNLKSIILKLRVSKPVSKALYDIAIEIEAAYAESYKNLRWAEDFTKYVASLEFNDPNARKGKRWDILSDVLNDIIEEAREIMPPKKKKGEP